MNAPGLPLKCPHLKNGTVTLEDHMLCNILTNLQSCSLEDTIHGQDDCLENNPSTGKGRVAGLQTYGPKLEMVPTLPMLSLAMPPIPPPLFRAGILRLDNGRFG